jgi:orotate phosphoribosyltransferase
MDINKIIYETKALLKGHFMLTSGNHSEFYIEKIKFINKPYYLNKIAKMIAKKLLKTKDEFDIIISPAYGAIALGFMVALYLKKDFAFTQRKDEKMSLRSGFNDLKNRNIYIVEDIITTGGSVKEVKDCIENVGGTVKGIFCIIDRSGGVEIDGIKPNSLMQIKIDIWSPQDCPLCKNNIPLDKPGSSDKNK